MPMLKGSKLEFSIRMDPDMYRQLADMKAPNVPISTFCTGLLADVIGYQKGL